MRIYDLPSKTIEKFRVYMDGEEYFVTRKTILRKRHHMGCSDGLPEDYSEEIVDYDIYTKVSDTEREQIVEELER